MSRRLTTLTQSSTIKLMDNLPKPDEPVVITTRRSLPKVPIIIAVLIILLAIILGLKYFNLIQFPKIPNFFPKPPAASSSSAKLTGKPAPAPKVTLSCPVEKEFCSKAGILELSFSTGDKKYEGLGWMLQKDSPIKAAFDGSVKQQDIAGAKPTTRLITLTSKGGQYEVDYIFVAKDKLTVAEQNKKEIEVKTGDTLATITGTTLAGIGFPKANLKFYIIDKKNKGIIVKIKPEDLDNLILP